jgi:hypothetical protein
MPTPEQFAELNEDYESVTANIMADVELGVFSRKKEHILNLRMFLGRVEILISSSVDGGMLPPEHHRLYYYGYRAYQLLDALEAI